MITNLIVISSLIFACAFLIIWGIRQDLREEIERPKHRFQDLGREYDRQCHQTEANEENRHA